MRALLVGAGAVGQAYGLALAKAGVSVSFYVREKVVTEIRSGLTVYNAKGIGARLPVADVVTTADAIRAGRYDQVWLCVSTDALLRPDLLPVIEAARGSLVVNLVPGDRAAALLTEHLPADLLVHGMISLVAWAAPLPGERLDGAGVRVWYPLGSPSPFSGPRAAEVVALLRQGGCPATVAPDTAWAGAAGSTVLLPTMFALELAGWSFARWRAETAALGASASREALAAVSQRYKRSPWVYRLLGQTWVLSLVSRLARVAAPVDLEVYFRVHFSKIGVQTRMALAEWIRETEALQLPNSALKEMAARLGPAGV